MSNPHRLGSEAGSRSCRNTPEASVGWHSGRVLDLAGLRPPSVSDQLNYIPLSKPLIASMTLMNMVSVVRRGRCKTRWCWLRGEFISCERWSEVGRVLRCLLQAQRCHPGPLSPLQALPPSTTLGVGSGSRRFITTQRGTVSSRTSLP